MKISPEQVVEAYEASGIKAIQTSYYDEEAKYGCGLTALYLKEHKVLPRRDNGRIHLPLLDKWFDDKFGEMYINGFISGFDGDELSKSEASNELLVEGFGDGKAAWEAVEAKGLVIND